MRGKIGHSLINYKLKENKFDAPLLTNDYSFECYFFFNLLFQSIFFLKIHHLILNLFFIELSLSLYRLWVWRVNPIDSDFLIEFFPLQFHHLILCLIKNEAS
jgi:hypothetical protein